MSKRNLDNPLTYWSVRKDCKWHDDGRVMRREKAHREHFSWKELTKNRRSWGEKPLKTRYRTYNIYSRRFEEKLDIGNDINGKWDVSNH